MELDNQQERPSGDLSWLAGIWEGEGWLSLIANYKSGSMAYKPTCGMCNTNMKIIDETVGILNGNKIAHWVGKPKKNGIGTKPKCDVVIQGLLRAERFLTLMRPYFRLNCEKADMLMRFIEYRKSVPHKQKYGDIEHSIYLGLQRLNNRSHGILREHTLGQHLLKNAV